LPSVFISSSASFLPSVFKSLSTGGTPLGAIFFFPTSSAAFSFFSSLNF